MQKIVINRCYGGFGLSPEAYLWLWENGCKDIGTPVKDWYANDNRGLNEDLLKWQNYLKNKTYSYLLTVFDPTEQFVLYKSNLKRDDPLLVKCVETLGKKVNDSCSDLEIIEIPDGIEWQIEEHDGAEWIAEAHRRWP